MDSTRTTGLISKLWYGSSESGAPYAYTYSYDAVGNILTATKNGTAHSYSYTDATWKDRLTAYDGHSITYDASGNPTSYYNGRDYTFQWEQGRQLAQATAGGSTVTYTYDLNGLRLGKVTADATHSYLYAGSKLLRETRDYGETQDTLDFFYDQSGMPYALKYNSTTYYYVLNLQGDVMALVDGSNNSVATYTYSPYGEVLTATGTLANINPLRYRGYYYDTETSLYYLQSRYYDPAIGRFVNPDAYTATGQGLFGYNMYAYCGNNPVNRSDDGGKFWNLVIGAVVGAAVSAVTTAIQTYKETGKVDLKKTVISAAVGGVSGLVAATGLGVVTQATITAGVSFAGDFATQVVCEGKSLDQVDYLKATHNAVLAGGLSMVGSVLGGVTSSGYSATGKTLVSEGKNKLLTGYVKQSAGQSYSKLISSGNKLISSGMKHINTGRGISSVTGTIMTWGVAQKYSWD